jgi:hypothetical protein
MEQDHDPSRSGLYVGLASLGCLLLLFCGFVPIMGATGMYVWQKRQAAYYGYDWGSTWAQPAYPQPVVNYEEMAWGQIVLKQEPTNLYTSGSTSSVVLETQPKGTKADYFGYDDTGFFYKVKTTTGTFGYVDFNHAEMEVYLGQVRVTVASTSIYESNDTTSTVLETRSSGDLLDWYGYDSLGNYYKVRTSDGRDGYVSVGQAEVPW